MKNKSSSRKPRLNEKQRAWVNSFLSSHPNARVRTIYELDGDRVVQIEWWENTNPVILDPKTYIQGIISYNMWVKLRKSGDPRKTSEFSYRITPPEKRSALWHLTGQLSLELPQCYEVAEPNNPVIIKPKRRNTKTKKVKKFLQYTLSLSEISVQLYTTNIKDDGVTLYGQEILLENTTQLNLDTGKDTKLPEAIVKILSEKQASLKEWETAITLYEVAGSSGVIEYLQQLDSWRKYLGNQPVDNHIDKDSIQNFVQPVQT
ncbi:hypothetical protein IQ278_00935 [Tolypothrix sp. LEGE 11397]|uniref:hypothetical protein n=1 Tax=Nostocales TaxID=1161 RepID=UPI000720E369|nr:MULTISPECIES: hypothetical protein [Nostocales]BAY95176.1 hypothetical protein NIES3275_72330 [Microchaete diplosiphon NIES-3275]MBE9080728.1 hypothetical protein [Tolypothrix sp. LEGE 11397]UYD30321.1 hypothetical protein HGR01_36480 [Tolypothrix sp. PCC 7712]UYD38237.1 hypothetical protein HG267_36775 [Tolypothrix sp. PCC 7601]BAU04529.1 unknown protein [Fischerella sp. NIES-3754]